MSGTTTNPNVWQASVDAIRESVAHPAFSANATITVSAAMGPVVIGIRYATPTGRSRSEAFELDNGDDARDLARVLAHAVGTRLADEDDE